MLPDLLEDNVLPSAILSHPIERIATEHEVLARVAEADAAAQRLTALEEWGDDDLMMWIMPSIQEAWYIEFDDDDKQPFALHRAHLGNLRDLPRELRQDLVRRWADAEFEYYELEAEAEGGAMENLTRDLAYRDDLHALTLAALRAGARAQIAAREGTRARAVDREIQWQMTQLKEELGFLADLRAYNLRQEYGEERGAQARMAADLDISAASVSTLLSAADQREQTLRETVAEAAATYENED